MNTLFDSKNSRLIVAASVAVAAVVTTGFLLFGSKSSDDMLPALTEEETVKIMSLILERTKVAAIRLARGAEGIKQQIAEQGVQMDVKVVLKQFVLPHVESAIQEIQTQIYQQHDIEECDVEEAFHYYCKEGNSELISISKKMKGIYNEFGGDAEIETTTEKKKVSKKKKVEGSVGVEEVQEVSAEGGAIASLDEDSLIMVLEKLSKEARTQTGMFIEGFINTVGQPTTPELAEQFQMGMMAVSQQVQLATLEAHGLTMEAFEAAVTKYQASERLRICVTRMQMETQEALASYGLQMQ